MATTPSVAASLPVAPYTRQIHPGGIAVYDDRGMQVAWLPIPPREDDDVPDATAQD